MIETCNWDWINWTKILKGCITRFWKEMVILTNCHKRAIDLQQIPFFKVHSWRIFVVTWSIPGPKYYPLVFQIWKNIHLQVLYAKKHESDYFLLYILQLSSVNQEKWKVSIYLVINKRWVMDEMIYLKSKSLQLRQHKFNIW